MRTFKLIIILNTILAFVFCSLELSYSSPSKIVDQVLYYSKEAKFLEQAEGKNAIQWAYSRTKMTKTFLKSMPVYDSILETVENVFYDNKKLLDGIIYKGYVYSYWNDNNNIQGVWRRTLLSEYSKELPEWEILIDFDQLSKKLKNKIVFIDAIRCPNKDNLFLIHMSFGGKDETFFEEWDLLTKSFINKGFSIKGFRNEHLEGRFTKATWVNSENIVFNPVFKKTDITKSLYPNSLYLWKRGQSIKNAKKIYSIPQDYIHIWTERLLTDSNAPSLVYIAGVKDFYNQDNFILDENLNLNKVYMPPGSIIQGAYKEYVFLLLKSDWKIKKVIPKGSLVVLHWRDLLKKDHDKTTIKAIFTPKPREVFDSIAVTKNSVFLITLKNVSSNVYILKLNKDKWSVPKIFSLPYKKACITMFSSEAEEEALIKVENKIISPSMYLLDKSHKLTLIREPLYKFDKDEYILEQRQVPSTDGIMIPYFITYKKGTKFNGLNPTLLTAYGGFQMINFPYFNRIENEVWINNGGIVVLANIRGGGEFGPDWHTSAIQEKRQNSFNDFIAVAEDLIKKKVTSPPYLGIIGKSNGGLLVSVAMIQRPNLFGAVACEMPVLDMIRYTEFGSGNAWISEYGDPNDPKTLKYLKKYAPLENISLLQKYPIILITSSVWDQRVHPWHARIFQYVLEKHPSVKSYFLENYDGGHSYGANLKDMIDYFTNLYTFLAVYLKLDTISLKGNKEKSVYIIQKQQIAVANDNIFKNLEILIA